MASAQTQASIRQLLSQAEANLAGMPSARLDAEILLATSLNRDRSHLYTYPEGIVSTSEINIFNQLLEQRLQHYPVAYLTGHREFWSLELRVNQHTLIPRAETECLVETVLNLLSDDQAHTVLDLGTGSGAIALALAKEKPNIRVTAVDKSREALKVARYNAQQHAINNIEFLESDWFNELDGYTFDLIVSNPPYVESDYAGFSDSEIRYEPRQALDGGRHGLDAIAEIIPGARQHLNNRASLVIEHGFTQAENLKEIFLSHGYNNVICVQDSAEHDRVSTAIWE